MREQSFVLTIKHLYRERTLGNAGKQVDSNSHAPEERAVNVNVDVICMIKIFLHAI